MLTWLLAAHHPQRAVLGGVNLVPASVLACAASCHGSLCPICHPTPVQQSSRAGWRACLCISQVGGGVTYNGRSFQDFRVHRTAGYIEQEDVRCCLYHSRATCVCCTGYMLLVSCLPVLGTWLLVVASCTKHSISATFFAGVRNVAHRQPLGCPQGLHRLPDGLS